MYWKLGQFPQNMELGTNGGIEAALDFVVDYVHFKTLTFKYS